MSYFRTTLIAAALMAAMPAFAQTAPAGTSSTGNFPVITVPPPPMSAVTNPPTPGADSTLWSNGIPGPQNSSVTIPISAGSGGGGGGGGGFVCTPGQTQACANTACPPNYAGSVPTSETCASSGTWPSACTPTVATIDANPTAYGCTPIGGTCTPGSSQTTQTAQCPSGETVGGVTGGATSFQQTVTTTTTCPSGSTGAPQTTTSYSPTAATECATPSGGIGGTTCSVQCPVHCTLYKQGLNYVWTQSWLGGANCPSSGTQIQQATSNTEPSFCYQTTRTYTYTTAGVCP